MRSPSLFKELFLYLVKRKKWWMWVIIIACLFSALIIFLTQSSAIAPFIYPIF